MEQNESKLRIALNKKNIRPADFARLMNLNPQTVTHWLNRGIPHKNLLQVASMLDLPISELSEQKIQSGIKVRGLFEGQKCLTSKDFIEFLYDDIKELPLEELLKLAGAIELIYTQKKKSVKPIAD